MAINAKPLDPGLSAICEDTLPSSEYQGQFPIDTYCKSSNRACLQLNPPLIEPHSRGELGERIHQNIQLNARKMVKTQEEDENGTG